MNTKREQMQIRLYTNTEASEELRPIKFRALIATTKRPISQEVQDFLPVGSLAVVEGIVENGLIATELALISGSLPEGVSIDGNHLTVLSSISGENEEWEITVLPIEVNSMDRYMVGAIPLGAIEALGGTTEFGLVFRNTSSGEEYLFNKISEAHVYNHPLNASPEGEDAFLSNHEISAWANGVNSEIKELNQDVVFYRHNGSLHFRLLFDNDGQIEIGLIKASTEMAVITHTLTRDKDIGSLLETVDRILSGTWIDPGGINDDPDDVIIAAASQGVSEEDLEATRDTANEVAVASIGAGEPTEFSGFMHRNLTTKVNILTWNAVKKHFISGVRQAGDERAREITFVTFAGKGFVEGAWMGVKDDSHSLVEMGEMIRNPAEIAKTFYEGFKVLIELDLGGWKNVGKTLVRSFLTHDEKGHVEWIEPKNFDVTAYVVGFTTGYIPEQILVTYAKVGLIKVGNVGAKIGQFIQAASKGVVTPLAEAASTHQKQALQAKNALFRSFSSYVSSADDVKILKRGMNELTANCPLCSGIDHLASP